VSSRIAVGAAFPCHPTDTVYMSGKFSVLKDVSAPEVHLGHPIFEGVDAALARALHREGIVRVIPAGQIAIEEGREGGSLFILSRGAVATTCSNPEGGGLLTGLLVAPAVFGEIGCLTGAAQPETARVLEKALVLEIPCRAVQSALRSSPVLAKNLLTELSKKLTAAVELERALAFQTVEVRLARLFGAYAARFGLPVPGGTKIRVPLTQEELAASLGVARRSVTRALERWAREGLVWKDGRCFVIREPSALLPVEPASQCSA
jgi:CRP/FNR family transcriptional regulator, cyclic AMP receptor protein